jgi:integrase
LPKKVVKGLTARGVKRIDKRGLHTDGDGLSLQVARNGSRSWIFRYRLGGKRRYLGLGPLSQVSLAEARDRAATARRQLFDGIDPIEARRGKRMAAAPLVTFRQCAEKYMASHRSGWRNAKHADQWSSSLVAYVYPEIGALPVSVIETSHVRRVLDPIWGTKPETARRVRGRIEAVLDWAKVAGYREGENPARWRGHLAQLLPAKGRVARNGNHHAAVPYSELPGLMSALRSEQSIPARALEFTILTAARIGEVLNATWDEVNLDARMWVIPAHRMKAGREHRVPLSDAATALLTSLPTRDGLIFPGQRLWRLHHVLKDVLGRTETIHGFRSSFVDWAHEKTSIPAEAIELALAHTVSNKVEAAYRRGDMVERRRELMQAWANHCSGGPMATVHVLRPERG